MKFYSCQGCRYAIRQDTEEYLKTWKEDVNVYRSVVKACQDCYFWDHPPAERTNFAGRIIAKISLKKKLRFDCEGCHHQTYDPMEDLLADPHRKTPAPWQCVYCYEWGKREQARKNWTAYRKPRIKNETLATTERGTRLL